ncbi:hypothetical protein OC845_002320 [Tilletia horrida]|nr:hypothetical protein OC845_002320 [Tilletia horrida]
MNGSPRLNKLTPVHENDDIMDGFMLPPPRTRTFASKSAYSTVAAKKSQSGASERPSRHSRSQSAFAMPTIGNALQTVCPSSPKTSKGISTTAISTVLATFVDNIDIRATEMQPAPQFRNPFLQSSPSLTSSSSHCTFGDNFGRPSLTSTSPAFPTSATMPDLASVLATESHALDITTRHRTVSSCSTNVKSRATALGMPVSNSGTIELQPHAMFFPRSAPHWPHSPPPSSHRARDPSSSFSSTRIPLYAQLPGRSSAGHSRQQSQSDRTRIDPIFNTGGQNGTLGRTAAQYSSSAGPRRANSLPKGYLPQYKEFREPVRASHVANVRSARSRHIEEPGHQAASHVPGRHLFTHAHLNNSTSSLHSASQASPTLGSLRIPRGSSTKRNELLRPIDTALANKGRKANSSRRAASIADESGSPTDTYLDVPPLSSGTTSSASSISSASLDARAMSRVESSLPIPDTTYGKHGSGDATITERDRWHSLAYVRGREYFPVGPDTVFDSNPGIESASSGARSSSPDKFPRSDSFRSTTDTHRRQSSISSSLSFLIWPSRPSTSSIVHNDSMLRHADGSDAGVERSYRQTQSGLGMSYEHQSEYGQQEEDEEEAALDELAGWNSYVSMTDVHSPVLDRSPVFSSARPALTRGKGSVRVL